MNALVQISTNPNFSSLNLAQAVNVCAYQCYTERLAAEARVLEREGGPPKTGQFTEERNDFDSLPAHCLPYSHLRKISSSVLLVALQLASQGAF